MIPSPSSDPQGAWRRRLGYGFLIGLFFVGYVHWLLFFNLAGPTAFQSAYDWGKEFRYYNPIRQGLLEGRIPYHTEKAEHLTHRLLANPEVILSPQIVLLKYLEIPWFIVVNTLLAYAVGYLGLLGLRARYRLSALPFTVLFLLYNFNGHLTAHLGVGHAIWTGYFFLPLFIWLFLRACEEPQAGPHWIPLALVLFLIVLQGFFHGYNACVIFLLLSAIWNPRVRRTALLAIAASLPLCACRFWPAAMTFWGREHLYITGFPTVVDWLAGMTVLRDYYAPFRGGLYGKLTWMEFDYYVGGAAFAFLLYFGVFLRLRPDVLPGGRAAGPAHRGLDLPLAVMTFLSFDYFLAITRWIPIPLLGTERVATRLFLLPFLFVTLFACLNLDRLLCRHKLRWEIWMFLWVGVIQTATTLWDHSALWRPDQIVDRIVLEYGWDPYNPIVERADPAYKAVFLISLAVSLLSLLILLVLWWWRARMGIVGGVGSEDTGGKPSAGQARA